jgi:hypothetical protein
MFPFARRMTLELIELAALFVLCTFLYLSYRRRVLDRAEPDHWTPWEGGKAFDATDLNKTLKRVRSDHLAARPQPKATPFHRSLVSFARRAVAHLPYFRDRATHEPYS